LTGQSENIIDLFDKERTLFFAERPVLWNTFSADPRNKVIQEIFETERTFVSCLLEMTLYRSGLATV
jgi:hypothetical protein